MKIRFLWDFFGPRAEGTAKHFEKHLLQFLAANSLTLPTGVLQESENHVVVFCDPPDVPGALQQEAPSHEAEASTNSEPTKEAIADQIGRALRPNRVEPVPEH
jgi:hypothetical protein